MTALKHTTWSSLKGLSLLALSILLLSGCMNRLGKLDRNLWSNTQRQLVPVEILQELTGRVKVIAPPDSGGNYLFATGSGDYGFGVYNLESGSFFSERKVLQEKNFLGSDPASIGSIAQAGRYLFVSGSQGLTQIDISNSNNPAVYRHLPQGVQVDIPVSKYQWNAMVSMNNGTVLLGFSGNRMYALSATGSSFFSNPFAELKSVVPAENVMNEDLSCGKGGTVFRGYIYLAACSKVLRFDSIDQSGVAKLANDFPYSINAQQIFSTERYLYVYHVPVNGRGSVAARSGIYMFDMNLQQVNFIPVTPKQSSHTFSVSSDDEFLFVNDTDRYLSVYRIPWTNSGF